MIAPLIHIGLHRTGSTWFQTRVLDGRDGRPVNAVPDRAESTARLVLARDLDFDFDETRHWLEAQFQKAKESGSASVLSNERLSGNPAAGWHDFEPTIARLSALAPTARFLMVVREQHDLARSIWLQQVRIGHPAGARDFWRAAARGDHRLPVPDPGFLRFDRVVEYLDRIIGRERVLVLPYELLRQDASDFLARISAFSGIHFPAPLDVGPVFAAPTTLEAAVLRRVNRWSVRSSLNRAPAMPWLEAPGRRLARFAGRCATSAGERRRRARIAAVVESRLDGLGLAESNRRLSSRLGIDLGRLGWAT